MIHKFAFQEDYYSQLIASGLVDSFGRQRVSTPSYVFDGQFTYNLLDLQFEQITSGAGATVAHNSTDRCALFTMAATPLNGQASVQSFDYFRYQPGRSQQIFLTFNFIAASAQTTKFIGYSDGDNGIELQYLGSGAQFVIYSDTGNGDQVVLQADWNIDKMNGSGPSGLTMDWTKVQILVIDFQALYTGRVRVGFIINGLTWFVHEFDHANSVTSPYIQTANLPIRAGMVATDNNATTTMKFICCSVMSEGGQEDIHGYEFSAEGTATAASGARTHILSVQPNATFNALENRIKFVLDSIEIIATGNFPVKWELVIGQALSGASGFTDVNATYSGFEFNTAGTANGAPAVVIQTGYVATSAARPVAISHEIQTRYPISLNAAGAVRVLGRLSLLVQGIGGDSATRAAFMWKEIR